MTTLPFKFAVGDNYTLLFKFAVQMTSLLFKFAVANDYPNV